MAPKGFVSARLALESHVDETVASECLEDLFACAARQHSRSA